MKGVVGFELLITRLEGKFKMSQNRSTHDRERVVEELHSIADATGCEVAAIMGRQLDNR